MLTPLSPAVTRALAKPRWTRADARVVLEACAASGLTPFAFARAHGCSANRLYDWKDRVALVPKAAAPAPLQFVELRMPAPPPAPPPSPSRLELVLPSGATVRVEGGVDPEALRTLLTVLREVTSC